MTELLEVGRIHRSHGLAGELVVDLITNRVERVAAGTVLFAGPQRTALTIVSSRPQNAKHLVRFEGVNSREASDLLRGLALYAPPIDDPEELWIHELIGKHVVDQHGVDHGPVEAVEVVPLSDLVVLESGGMIPMAFVRGVGPDGRVEVEIPPGLLDE